MIPANLAPNTGDAKTATERIVPDTSIPRPMLDHLDFLGEKKPIIICSIATKNNTMASIQTIEI